MEPKKSILIYKEYTVVVNIARTAIAVVAVMLYLASYISFVALVVILLLDLGNVLYARFLMPLIETKNETLALYLNSSIYLVAAVLLIYYTGGLTGPLYLLLFFAPIGMAMSYGPSAAFYTVGLEFFTLAILSVLDPVNSMFGLSLERLMMYLVPLFMTAPFAMVTAKRYVDITAEKEKVEQLAGALNESLRKERDMLDILGHELRTPLAIVRNAVQMLMRFRKLGKLTKEKEAEYLNKADENTDRLAKQLETILYSTKIDNQKLTLNFEKVDVIDAIKDSLEGLKDKAKKKGLEIILELPTQAFAYADRARVQQIFDNLIDNAVKYTDEGSIKINLTAEDNSIVVSVLDTGKGIPEEDLANLGQKFYRVDTYSSNDSGIDVIRPGGTGIGLYVTFQLARVMGGKVTVSSKLGAGSTFTVYLPTYSGQATVKGKTLADLINERFAHNGNVAYS